MPVALVCKDRWHLRRDAVAYMGDAKGSSAMSAMGLSIRAGRAMDSPFDGVFQLTYVTGPGMACQQILGRCVEKPANRVLA